MRLILKKVSAIAASALMVGMTMGVAAAANYPAPFVVGGAADAAIVYGTGSGVSTLDVVQAGNIEANLQSFMSAGGGSSTTSVSGGDSKILSSSTRKLYYGDNINSAITSLTYTELPTLLASGTVTDLSGTAYGYTQTVKVGNAAITYGTSGGDLADPVLLIDAGNNGALSPGQLYNYTLSFTKSINVSDATNVQGQKVKIMGIDYVIGANSNTAVLYLYGSGSSVTLTGGTGNQSVNVGGTNHAVELVTTTTSNAIIRVDGVSKTVVSGSNYAFAGGINVYVKTIINPSYAGDLRQVELIVGASSLQLSANQSVKKGADATSVQGTLVSLTGSSNVLSSLTISVGAQKTQNDSIALGQTFTDPVFGGLQVTLANVVPSLDPSARGRIVVDGGASGTQIASVTFTSARAGTTGEKKLQYVYDNNTATSGVFPLLAGSTQPNSNGKGIIHVLEGENARVGDWVVVNQGDAGTILYVQDAYAKGDGLSGTVILSDAITGESQTLTVTNDTTGTMTFRNTNVNAWGGTGYTLSASSDFASVNITWGNLVSARTVFPRIKLANGGWIAFLTQTTLGNNTISILPDGQSTLATTGTNISSTLASAMTAGGINWTLGQTTAVGAFNITGISNANAVCNFNYTMGPAILYLEPKKWNDQTYGDFICVPLTTTGTSTVEIYAGDPVFNGSYSGFVTGSDTYKKAAIDKFGSFVTKETRTGTDGVATIYLAPSQMYLDTVFSAPGVSITGSTVTVSGAQLGDILVKDSEVSTVSASKSLIVVGGSCINSVAATLLGGAYCGASFTTATNVGSGQFLIRGFPDAFSTGNIALVVAGYEAADTVNAATYLRTQPVDTSKKYIGTSSTSATLQVA